MPKGHETYIEDYMLEGYGCLDENGIQTYLEHIGSWLREKTCVYGGGRIRFSKFIDMNCQEFDIEPIWMLSLIQKEQSALYKKTPIKPEIEIKICGYGYTEEGVMKEFQGFENQLYNATKAFRRYDKNGTIVKWETNQISLYDSSSLLSREGYDSKIITASTRAEAKAFRYNPRIEGIKNHAKIWNEIYNTCKELNLLLEEVEEIEG